MTTNLGSSDTRQDVEEYWRRRLEESQVRYRKATEHYRKLLQEQPKGAPYNPNGALALARQAESQALADHTRLLRIFTQLTVYGQIPNHQSVIGPDGV